MIHNVFHDKTYEHEWRQQALCTPRAVRTSIMHGMKGADKHYGEHEYGSDKQAQSQAVRQAQTTQANPQIQEEPGSGAGAATQT